MTDQYIWADLGPKRSVLMLVRENNPFNKKIAEVFYNELDKDGFVARIHDENNPLVGNWIADAIKTKQEAMEIALVELVSKRIDKANGVDTT